MKKRFFFPTTAGEMKEQGIKQLDIILVTGEAFIDHPSFGIAVMARLLESHGYKTGIIEQPDWTSTEDFKRLGHPRLFFGVTSGGLDSMLAGYTATKKRRHDERTSSGTSYKMPDRAIIMYCNKLREAFKGIPIVIGGIEASLRRLGHYDYWSNSVRRSILLDSRADVLVYGMGERQILEIAKCFEKGISPEGIKGTVIRYKKNFPINEGFEKLPTFRDISSDKEKFIKSHIIKERENNPFTGKPLIEEYETSLIIQYPPPLPLSEEEMDYIYELPFTRRTHPKYSSEVKALEPVLFSIITHRGCFGGCSFCSIGFHQGKYIQNRSINSILKEIEKLAGDKRFKGYIDDLGGPTANMYGMNCGKYNTGNEIITCPSLTGTVDIKFRYNKNFNCHKTCMPGRCNNLSADYGPLKSLLKETRNRKGVEKVFVRSGVRYDLAMRDEDYLYELLKYHVSGQLKVAPEHVSQKVLRLMNKSPVEDFEEFRIKFSAINKKINKEQYLVPYFIVAHPGSGQKEAMELKSYLGKNRITVEQIQIFIPTPMTPSTCMYYGGKDFTGSEIYVTRDLKEKERQKKILYSK